LKPESLDTSDPIYVHVSRWAARGLRFAAGLFVVLALFLGYQEDGRGTVAIAGIAAFGVIYAFTPTWRAMAGPLASSALMSLDVAFGIGDGFAIGLSLWLAFHICAKPVRQFIAVLDGLPPQ